VSILREHGGGIEAQSLPAGGSAFIVTLPAVSGVREESVPNPPDVTPARGRRQVPTAVQGRSILVLDDEESIRSLLEEGLASHGLRVACVATAEEAARLIAAENFDALLCDLNLGVSSGISNGRQAASHVLAAAGANKPIVIFMTGDYAAEAHAREGFETATFLQKPFRILDVLAALRESFMAATTLKP
jgi:CheY-like chemotaxis protein